MEHISSACWIADDAVEEMEPNRLGFRHDITPTTSLSQRNDRMKVQAGKNFKEDVIWEGAEGHGGGKASETMKSNGNAAYDMRVWELMGACETGSWWLKCGLPELSRGLRLNQPDTRLSVLRGPRQNVINNPSPQSFLSFDRLVKDLD